MLGKHQFSLLEAIGLMAVLAANVACISALFRYGDSWRAWLPIGVLNVFASAVWVRGRSVNQHKSCHETMKAEVEPRLG